MTSAREAAITHPAASAANGSHPADRDRIDSVRLALIDVPLAGPISDAKVLHAVQKPLTAVSVIVAHLRTRDGAEGLGFTYTLRTGGPGIFAHARELAPLLRGKDPDDIGLIWNQLCWAGASVGRSGLTTHALAPFDVALWDLKARRAGCSLAKLLGSYRDGVRVYNTSGGYLSTPLAQIVDNTARSLERGIGGIKIKVGHPDADEDIQRVESVRKALGDHIPLMVDANQQWTRLSAKRIGRALDAYHLTWLEEPLDAYDAQGHAELTALLDTPIATGEMLTSVREHVELITLRSADYLQPDAARVGGITPFLRIMALADQYHFNLAPHFIMEIHIHLAAAFPEEPWIEHFEWLEPLFNERLAIENGHMMVPTRPGLGLSLSEQAGPWTQAEFAC